MNKSLVFLIISVILFIIAGCAELLSPLVHCVYANKFLFSGYQEDINIDFNTQGTFLLVTGFVSCTLMICSIFIPINKVQGILSAAALFFILISTIQEFYFWRDTQNIKKLAKTYIDLSHYIQYEDIPTDSDISSCTTAFLALAIIKCISMLAPITRIIAEPKFFCYMFLYSLLFGIFLPFPIYNGYLVFSKNYGSVAKDIGYQRDYYITVGSGVVALICFIIFGYFLFKTEIRKSFIALVVGLCIPTIFALIVYFGHPESNADLTKLNCCANTNSIENKNICLLNAHEIRVHDMVSGKLYMVLSLPYLILFSATVICIIYKLFACCVKSIVQVTGELLIDFVTNSFEYEEINEKGEVISRGSCGLFGYIKHY